MEENEMYKAISGQLKMLLLMLGPEIGRAHV